MSQSNSPNFRIVHLILNVESGWYIKQACRIAFNKIPERLKVEKTQDPRIRSNGANEVITGPFRAKRRTFFTGIQPLAVDGWYIGNDFEIRGGQKTTSLVLFQFTANDSELVVYYFTGWYKDSPTERILFANQFARRMATNGKKEGGV